MRVRGMPRVTWWTKILLLCRWIACSELLQEGLWANLDTHDDDLAEAGRVTVPSEVVRY